MGYNTDFYKKKLRSNDLEFMYTMSGSDCPQYYEEVKTWGEVKKITEEQKEDRGYTEKWNLPWKTSKISDDVIIFEEVKRKWWQIWKPKILLVVWKDVYYQKYTGKEEDREYSEDETKQWFTNVPIHRHYKDNHGYGDEYDWKLEHLRLFDLPIMKN